MVDTCTFKFQNIFVQMGINIPPNLHVPLQRTTSSAPTTAGSPCSLLLLTESNSQAVNSGQIYKSQRAQWAWLGSDGFCSHLPLGSVVLFQTQSICATTDGKIRGVKEAWGRVGAPTSLSYWNLWYYYLIRFITKLILSWQPLCCPSMV